MNEDLVKRCLAFLEKNGVRQPVLNAIKERKREDILAKIKNKKQNISTQALHAISQSIVNHWILLYETPQGKVAISCTETGEIEFIKFINGESV